MNFFPHKCVILTDKKFFNFYNPLSDVVFEHVQIFEAMYGVMATRRMLSP